MRIVSLVPSITELLYTLGLEQEVIGITKFCIHPQAWFRTKTRVGGTKTLNLEKIIALKPDLIIANKEENVKEQVEVLAGRFPVLLTDVNDYTGALAMIRELGDHTNRKEEAHALTAVIEDAFASLDTGPPCTAVYFIWKDPWMTVGGDTFINDMMQKAGFINLYAPFNRYPVADLNALQAHPPEYFILASEPYPFGEQHKAALQELYPDVKILLADGELFSWYGSRMLKAPAYFRRLRMPR
ncbi:helical backbone metal receptor [Niabella sp. CC-SYL272]|uniref:ABC transporter substrate-binding protein n=1 Tax=Niabella agricola TaxID=2891571 RepID=UPI001F3A94B2|nr:helical backbone metal receptor [Niabella agricola]MCF3109100.1 helical backbone metal receptor [Niabella agricola]